MTLVGITGCITTSIHPLYTPSDLIFDPALLGVWEERENPQETWAFEKSGEKEYRLVTRDSDGNTGEFRAHLLKLGDARFLDLFPHRKALDFHQAHLQPVHSFLKIVEAGPGLQLSLLDLEWLSTLLKETPQAIRHERTSPGAEDEGIILTASTKELQAFVLKHLNTPGAFGDKPLRLERAKPRP